MPAYDALTVRTQVTEQLRGAIFPQFIDRFCDDMADRGMARLMRVDQGRLGSDRFRTAMSIAETYYLSPDMAALALAASSADDFPDDEVILIEDLPSEAGFMHMPAPLEMVDMRGIRLRAHALLWLGETIWWLGDRRDPTDEFNAEIRTVYGDAAADRLGELLRWDLISIDKFDFGQQMPKVFGFPPGSLPPGSHVWFEGLPDGRTSVRTDAPMEPEAFIALCNEVTQPGAAEVHPHLKFLLTVWRLMQQTLSEVVREEPIKGVRRDALRAGIADPTVSVIQLRRRKSHATGAGRPLDHRVPVRGHWSRRWCGPADERVLRAVYIHPYVKGPDNAPLIVRDRVNALVR